MPAKTDPQKAAKQWAIAQAVIQAGPDAAVLYADESRIQLSASAAFDVALGGRQIRVPIPRTNVTRTLFGALNIGSGQWTYLVREHMYKEDFVAFLEHLLSVYATGPIISDRGQLLQRHGGSGQRLLAAQSRLQLFYLPKYCSHLNPVENIWPRLKGQIAANRLHGSLQRLLDGVAGFFRDTTPELALIGGCRMKVARTFCHRLRLARSVYSRRPCAFGLELGLGIRRGFLGDGAEHRGRSALDQVLRFLQAQVGQGAHDLDDVDLLLADSFRITSNSVCSSTTSAGAAAATGHLHRAGVVKDRIVEAEGRQRTRSTKTARHRGAPCILHACAFVVLRDFVIQAGHRAVDDVRITTAR